MSRLVVLALVAGCATQAPVATSAGEGSVVTGTVSAPSPVAHVRVSRTAPRASRSRRPDPAHGTGSLNSTAYCEAGLMANGHRTYRGAVAGNRWPLGTRLWVADSPYGAGVFEVADHIGHGSELDFAMPGDCTGARSWGRRDVEYRVAS